MAAVPEDIWNLASWGCRDRGHSPFTNPYLTTAERIFFAYRYFRHRADANPLVSKYYMEKAARLAGNGPILCRKPLPKPLASYQVPARKTPNRGTVNHLSVVHPGSDSEDSSEEDTVTKNNNSERPHGQSPCDFQLSPSDDS